jgi:uncharacterized protein
MRKSKIFLPDVNVWIAIAADGHAHHRDAMAWFETIVTDDAAFCRVTQMGFLRILTNKHAMKEDVLSQKEAWRVFDSLREDERVTYLAEPDGIEREWRGVTQHHEPDNDNNLWTDAYLHAFAAIRQAVVVTFDQAFAKSAGGQPLLLGKPR